MKNLLFILSIGLLLFFSSCKKDKKETCQETKIKSAQNASPATPRIEVWQWVYNGKRYLYVTLPAVCCDNYSSELYDDNCNFVCNPDGGFSGNGDGNCTEIKNNAVKTLIWKDSR